MRIGVRAHDFGRQDPRSLAQSLADAGAEVAQVAPTKAIQGVTGFDAVTPRIVEAIGEAFAAASVDIAVWGCYVEPAAAEERKWRGHLLAFCAALAQAKSIGVPLVGTETTHFPVGSEGREAAYVRLREFMLRAADVAERLGVNIGVEPVADHTLNTASLARRLLDEVGSRRLRIILDPVNLILPQTAENQREILGDAIERLGDRIDAVHAKDVVIERSQKVWRPIGEGLVDYPWLFARLRRRGPDLPVLREGVTKESCARDLASLRAYDCEKGDAL